MSNEFPKIPLILATVMCFLSVFAFIFLYKTIDTAEDNAKLASTELQNEANKHEEIKLLNSHVETLKEDMILLETHFAKSSDIVPFLDSMESLARKAGTKAEITSVDVAKDNTSLILKIKTEGSFKNIYKFLTLLENSHYVVEFMEISMERGAQGGATEAGAPKQIPVWQANFNLKLLSFIE